MKGEIKMDDRSNIKLVEFQKYCGSCKHWDNIGKMNPNIGEYDGENWSGKVVKEEYKPCDECLEIAARYGTEVPEYYEKNE